jgi:hypothetical protein
MRYFDFQRAVERKLASANTDEERLMARTQAGKEEFAEAARRAGLVVLSCTTEPLLPRGRCVVVGVATWSDTDMAALDSAVLNMRRRGIEGYVFDIDDCKSPVDVQRMLPDTGLAPTRTPVFGYYVDGRIEAFGQGADACCWLEQL